MDGLTILNNLFGIIGGIITIGGLLSRRIALRRRQLQSQVAAMPIDAKRPQPHPGVQIQRRFITHSVIFTIGISTIIVQYFLQAARITNNAALGELAVICFATQIGCWLAILSSLVKGQRGGWFIGMLFATIYSPIIYGLWGPPAVVS